jgi:hypothetical protein
MTSETTRQALCCECGAMTHASGRPVPEDRVRVEKAQGLTHRLGALLTHALCAEPLRPAFITPTREWSCLHHQSRRGHLHRLVRPWPHCCWGPGSTPPTQ